MDKTALRLLIKKVIAEGIKYDYEMKELGRGSYLYGFAATYVDEFEAILKAKKKYCACEYPRLSPNNFWYCQKCKAEIKKCDHYFPVSSKGVYQPCEFCGEIKTQTK